MLSSLLALIRLFMVYLRLYMKKLWNHLSVIQQQTSQQPRPTVVNRTYLATFISFSIALIYGTVGLHLESGQPLTVSSLRASRYLFWHQFLPRQTWSQNDTALLVVLFGEMIKILDFALKQPIQWQHQFTINSAERRMKLAGKGISTIESTKLLAMFHRARLTYNLFGLAIYSLMMLYCYIMVFFVTKVYSVSVWSLCYWTLGMPFKLAIVVIFSVVNLVHIILSGSCIQVRQQNLCQHFNRLLERLNCKRPSIGRLERIWPRYLTLNRIALSNSQQLQKFNAFYTNYLTLIFLEYIVAQVMFSYVVFFVSSKLTAIVVMKCIFTLTITETIVLLFGLIEYCARVVKKNGQIGRLNRQFAVHCLRYQNLYQLPTRQLLKIELFQWSRLLHFYAFKLFGNSRITSKTFYAMAINISGFFLFVTKRMLVQRI